MSNWTIERRFSKGEVEVRFKGGNAIMEGYAAVFDSRSGNLGGFFEEVANTAFTKTLNDGADVRALWNHDPSLLLGRTASGTARVAVDSRGLLYEVTAADTTYARDLAELMKRGDVNQSSFAFRTIEDDWRLEGTGNDEVPIRTLKEVGLVDVSPVTYPAYEDSTSGLIRSMALEGLAKRSKCEVGELCDVAAIRTAISISAKSKPSEDTSREQRIAERAKRLEELRALEAELTGSAQ